MVTLLYDGACVVTADQVIAEWYMFRFVDGSYAFGHWSELAVLA